MQNLLDHLSSGWQRPSPIAPTTSATSRYHITKWAICSAPSDRARTAREAFAKALAIAERLAKAEPDRADYQRDLIVSCVKMSEIDPERAPEYLSRALAIARALQDRGRFMPTDAGMVDDLTRRLAALAAPPARLGWAGRLMKLAAFWRAKS